MPQASKTFRIFVSSTFSDLKAERNALQEHVFPKLRELCAQQGCRFQAIDLRWGVSEEASRDQQTVKICLEEIKRCQTVTPRPNFIVLLGDRYGWRPPPTEIPADEFRQIVEQVANPHEKALLVWDEQQTDESKGWYRRDDNSVPAIYCLQPRTGEFLDYAKWEPVERRLHSILLQATARIALPHDVRIKYEASATEQEIVQGALNVANAEEHVFCFFRQITNLDGLIHDLPRREIAAGFVDRYESVGASSSADREAFARLADLKRRLADYNVHNYQAEWKGDDITSDHIGSLPGALEDCVRLIGDDDSPSNLCVDVWRRLARVILDKVKRVQSADPVTSEVDDHADFAKERAKFFTGREHYLGVIRDYLQRSDACPLCLWGESGSGKSALMAQAIANCGASNANFVVVSRFIGVTPASSDVRALLERLCRQISRAYRAEESEIPADLKELMALFQKTLELATAEHPLILFLDALDQLSNLNRARNLSWLPASLPDHVRMIVSTTSGQCLDMLEKMLPAANLLKLEPMPEEEGEMLLDWWLEAGQRTLQPQQRTEILSKFEGCGLPLYLKLAFEEARRWRSYDRTRPSGSDVAGIIGDLLSRLSDEANHGEVIVSRSLGYLSAGKNGLTEDELLDVLSRDESVISDFKRRSPKSPEAKSLPVVVWSRMYFDISAYLTERSADGANLLAFFHRQFSEVVAERYCSGDAKVERHQGLARYFQEQPLLAARIEEQGINIRKVSELTYQQARAEMWDELEATLCNPQFISATSSLNDALNLQADLEAVLSTGAGVSRIFRVYVCSPFSDFVAERNALHEHVFPQLRELCRQHRAHFLAVDLQWGLEEEAFLDQSTMKTRIEEIERCQMTTPRPNFMVLLGNRYGWRPLPEAIPADEFEQIQRRVGGSGDKELLESWYRRDENAMPPAYCLLPRQGEFRCSDSWQGVERRLRAILLQATEAMDLNYSARLKYTASAVEREIIRGVFEFPDAPEHVFCSFRSIRGLPFDESARRFLDLNEDGRPDVESLARLDDLKNRLRQYLPNTIYEYEETWTGTGITTDHLGQTGGLRMDSAQQNLCQYGYDELSRVILAEIARMEQIDPVSEEVREQEIFAVEATRFFVGRASYLSAIAEYVSRIDPHPLAVLGPAASGKSSLIARAAKYVQEQHPYAAVVFRFIGTTSGSSYSRTLLESLYRQVSRCYGPDESKVPTEYRQLVEGFPKLLSLATSERPLLVFLDALDQISEADDARSLSWLPDRLPENVRMIVSTRAGECLEALESRLPATNLIELEPLPLYEAETMLHLWLTETCRTLQLPQRQEVLSKFEESGLPLYFKLVFQEAVRWQSYSQSSHVDSLSSGSDIQSILYQVFSWLANSHGHVLVGACLAYLAASRYGLTEYELLDVLSTDPEVAAELRHRPSLAMPEDDRLPFIMWSRLYADLEPKLTTRNADGEGVLSFYGSSITETVVQYYLPDASRQERHRRLAEYFRAQPLLVDLEKRIPNRRKLLELAYQMNHAIQNF